MIRHVADPGSVEYQRHLQRLVQSYWKPIYWVIRKAWRRSDSDAKDLTQEFFAEVVVEGALAQSFAPERGSFRAFLRSALTNFMRNESRYAVRQKRGGGAVVLSFDETVDGDFEAPAKLAPEEVFDKAWSQVVMKEAMAVLETKLAEEGKSVTFEVFKRYDLFDAGVRPSYAELGQSLGLSSQQVKHALTHAREAFRHAVTEVVSEYVDGPDEIAQEIRTLLRS